MKTKRKATLSLSGTNLYFPYFSCLKKIQKKYLKQELYFRRRKSIVFICIPGYWLFSGPLKNIFLQHSDGQGLNGSGLRSVRKSVSRNLPERRTEGEGGGLTNTNLWNMRMRRKRRKSKKCVKIIWYCFQPPVDSAISSKPERRRST